MLRLCTLIFQYDIHKNALKSQYYYPDLIELQNAPLSLWFSLGTRLIIMIKVSLVVRMKWIVIRFDYFQAALKKSKSD